MTIEIRSWIANASPGPRTWAWPFGQGLEQEVADLVGEVEPDGRTGDDGEDDPEEPVAQLAEVVDERHDRLIGHRSPGAAGGGRTVTPGGLAEGVGVGHQGRATPTLVRARGAARSGRRARSAGRPRPGGFRRGSGEVSTLTESFRSDEALRNSRMLLPIEAPTSGSLPGPRISSAITRMMMSSRVLIGMSGDPFVAGGG